jgi:hypothetical protein
MTEFWLEDDFPALWYSYDAPKGAIQVGTTDLWQYKVSGMVMMHQKNWTPLLLGSPKEVIKQASPSQLTHSKKLCTAESGQAGTG